MISKLLNIFTLSTMISENLCFPLANVKRGPKREHGQIRANPCTRKEEHNPVSQTERSLHPGPAQQDDKITETDFGFCMVLEVVGQPR